MSDALKTLLTECFASVVDDRPYSLIDYPLYNNPGDSMIWLGSRILLEQITGRPPAYVATLRAFEAKKCKSAIGSGTIFMLGGGNFGDLYPKHQEFRLRVLRAAAGNRVVLMPLSVAISDSSSSLLEQTTEALRVPDEVVAFARERPSQELLSDLGVRADLLPDAAHMLHIDAGPPDKRLVRLIRSDREALSSAGKGFDWTDSRQLRWINRSGKLFYATVPTKGRRGLFDWLSGARVHAAARLIASGERVETNRLHALILAQLLGRPVSFSDNSTGKLSAYVEAWGDHLTCLKIGI